MKWLRAATVGIALVLVFPAMALGAPSPSPSPSPVPAGVPEGNPGASLNGLPFSGSIQDLTMWVTGLGFAVCVFVFLSGAGILRPFGHLVGHEKTAVRGTTSMVAAVLGAVLLGAGFILVTFFWTVVGQGMH